jgi:hypothetical protein
MTYLVQSESVIIEIKYILITGLCSYQCIVVASLSVYRLKHLKEDL